MSAEVKSDNELIEEFYISQGGKPHDPADLCFYESDWNMLMPVVEKIVENYDFTIQFYAGDCNCYCTKQNYGASEIPGIGHGGFKPHIQSVYKSVVALIKHINKP